MMAVSPAAGSRRPKRMVIILWAVLDCNVWLAEAEMLLAQWPALTGRICPACGAPALVGHGRRRRSVHVGREKGLLGPVCRVVRFWVQRVRCKACGRTHTLLPAFVARYQRHPSQVRERATRLRMAGHSWQQVMKDLALPMLSATSPRRWVAGVQGRYAAVVAEMRRWLAAGPVGGASYASLAEPGSWAGFEETVGTLLAREFSGDWPAGEVVAGANWLSGRRRRPLVV